MEFKDKLRKVIHTYEMLQLTKNKNDDIRINELKTKSNYLLTYLYNYKYFIEFKKVSIFDVEFKSFNYNNIITKFKSTDSNNLLHLFKEFFIELTFLISTHEKFDSYLDEIHELLLMKNRKYGDAALSPLNVFTNAGVGESILLRIEDKLKRIQQQEDDEDEDVYLDVVGYFILYEIAKL